MISIPIDYRFHRLSTPGQNIPLIDWSKTTLNNVLLQGDKMYLQALDNGFVVLEPGVEFMSVDNLPKVVSISSCTNMFSYEICDSVIDTRNVPAVVHAKTNVNPFDARNNDTIKPIEAKTIDLPIVVEPIEAKTIDLPIVVEPIEAKTIDQPIVVEPVEAKTIDLPVEAKTIDLPIVVEPVEAKTIELPIVVEPIEAKAIDLPIVVEPVEAKAIDLPIVVEPVEAKTIDLPIVVEPIEAKTIDQPIEAKTIDQPIEAKHIDLPIVVEPIEAQNNIRLPIVVNPVEAKSNIDLSIGVDPACIEHNSVVTKNKNQICFINYGKELQGLVITNRKIASHYYDVHTALLNVFSNYSCTILILEGYMMALVKQTDFFCYSHARDSSGMPDPNGTALVMKFANILELEQYLYSLSMTLHANSFEIVPAIKY